MITIIPAIDLIDGSCVRLTQGDYDRKTTYYKDPLDVARRYEDCGIKRLHLVDLDGAKASHPVNLKVLERLATSTALQIQYGGGIKSSDALKEVFAAGAKRAICGSIAVKQPESFCEWLDAFGPERMVLGADTRNGRIAINGWLEAAQMGVEELIESFRNAGLSQVICTDIAKDGMLQGPATSLYQELLQQFPQCHLIASGGVSCLADIIRLNDAGIPAVVFGKAIYEGKISLQELAEWAENR